MSDIILFVNWLYINTFICVIVFYDDDDDDDIEDDDDDDTDDDFDDYDNDNHFDDDMMIMIMILMMMMMMMTMMILMMVMMMMMIIPYLVYIVWAPRPIPAVPYIGAVRHRVSERTPWHIGAHNASPEAGGARNTKRARNC